MQKQVTTAAKTKLAAALFCMQNAVQNLVQMTVQSSVQMILQKNGTDAEQFAETMQKEGYKLYGFSTRVNAGKRGFSGIARIIPAAEAQVIRFYPPDSQSILGLQKNGTDAEIGADTVQLLVQKLCSKKSANADANVNRLQRFVQNIVQKLVISDKAKNQQLEDFFVRRRA